MTGRSGGPTRSSSRCRRGRARRRPSSGASIPNDRWIEILTAAVVLVALNLFLRRTRYGLIVRAGVENRAMVTALGIDVRRAFTLVFAIGGVAAALAGVLSALYFGDGRPAAGHEPADLRLHRRRDRRPRLDRRHRAAAVLVALVQQFANYYASAGHRRSLASCCCSRSSCSSAPAG